MSVHATFLLLVAWFAVAYWFEVGSAARVASGVALFLLLFGCVLLHELGHALTAQGFGLATREIGVAPDRRDCPSRTDARRPDSEPLDHTRRPGPQHRYRSGPLSTVMELAQHGSQHEFPATRDGHVTGMLTRHDMLRGLAEGGPQSPVADAMERDVQIVDPHDMLDAALSRLDAGQSSTAPVVQDGRLIPAHGGGCG